MKCDNAMNQIKFIKNTQRHPKTLAHTHTHTIIHVWTNRKETSKKYNCQKLAKRINKNMRE